MRMLVRSIKWIGLSVFAVAMGSVAFQAQVQAQDMPPLKMRIAHAYPKGLPSAVALEHFAKRLGELSGGKITAQVYPGGTLYSENTATQAVVDGTIEVGMSSASNHGPFTKAWNVVELPFLFDNRQHFRDALINGPAGEELKKESEKDGLKPLMILETGGFRILHTTKLVKVPADLKGLKIRVPQSAIPLNFWKNSGASASVIAWPETYLALASHTVDGADSSFPGSFMGKIDEVAKYITDVHYASVASIVDVSVSFWNKLTQAQKDVIMKAAKEAEQLSLAEELKSENEIKDKLRKNGVTIYEPSATEMAEWKKIGKAMWKDVPNISQSILNRLQTASKSN